MTFNSEKLVKVLGEDWGRIIQNVTDKIGHVVCVIDFWDFWVRVGCDGWSTTVV
jgi:hypothetical protein